MDFSLETAVVSRVANAAVDEETAKWPTVSCLPADQQLDLWQYMSQQLKHDQTIQFYRFRIELQGRNEAVFPLPYEYRTDSDTLVLVVFKNGETRALRAAKRKIKFNSEDFVRSKFAFTIISPVTIQRQQVPIWLLGLTKSSKYPSLSSMDTCMLYALPPPQAHLPALSLPTGATQAAANSSSPSSSPHAPQHPTSTMFDEQQQRFFLAPFEISAQHVTTPHFFHHSPHMRQGSLGNLASASYSDVNSDADLIAQFFSNDPQAGDEHAQGRLTLNPFQELLPLSIFSSAVPPETQRIVSLNSTSGP